MRICIKESYTMFPGLKCWVHRWQFLYSDGTIETVTKTVKTK